MREFLAARLFQSLEELIVRHDKFVTVSIALDEIRERERISSRHEARLDTFDPLAAIRLKENSDRDREAGLGAPKSQRQDGFGPVTPRLSAFKISDLPETITENCPIALLARRRVEVDVVPVITCDNDLDAVENG